MELGRESIAPLLLTITLMCEEAKDLLLGYLDALEECDRVHRMVVASTRREDRQAADGYRLLLSDGRLKLSVARGNYRRHQVFHACSEIVNFGDSAGAGGAAPNCHE